MVEGRELGAAIATVGLVTVIVGVVVWAGGLSWFGKLPGDLQVERQGIRLFVPLTSMLLVSVLLSVVVALIRRLW